jgi:hypothetical protein
MLKTKRPNFSSLLYRVKLSYVTRLVLILLLLSTSVSAPVPSSAFSRFQCPEISCAESAAAGTNLEFSVDPGSYSPTYSWSVSSGSITSGQRTSSITVGGVSAGQSCEATVFMRGLPASCTKTLLCSTDVSAPCSAVTIGDCPGVVRAGTRVRLTADLASDHETAHATSKPNAAMTNPSVDRAASQDGVTFNWSVSGGTITSGQGTPNITIDTRGLRGQTVTATVEVGGDGCTRVASCSFSVN